MSINWNSIFDDIHNKRAARTVTFREAIGYSLASEAVTYASDAQLTAKVLWRNDGTEFRRGVWVEEDQASLVIWFKDLTSKTTGTSSEITDWTARFKGAVNEGVRERYSRFIIDGQRLKAREVFPIERPDGNVYALRVLLEAAE